MVRLIFILLSFTLLALIVCLDASHAQQNFANNPQAPDNRPAALSSGIFKPAQIIAMVGDQPILAGDLFGTINRVLAPYEGKASKEQIDNQRRLLMPQLLRSAIETKLVYLDFLREIPAENLPRVQEQIDEQFNDRQLDALIQSNKVSNAAELDAKLRQYGSSIAHQKRIFSEQTVAQQLLRRNVNFKPEVTHQEMIDFYREREADYAIAAKARWEQLMVLKNKFANRADAWRAMANMGNEVLRGAPLAAVAKRHSHGLTAEQGGQYDWITQGSLASKVLDDAIFSLPPQKMSPILEDERGFHIVRVIQRQAATLVPFVEAQVEIKRQITKDKVAKERIAYLQRLKKKTPVWTIYDSQAQEANQAAPLRR